MCRHLAGTVVSCTPTAQDPSTDLLLWNTRCLNPAHNARWEGCVVPAHSEAVDACAQGYEALLAAVLEEYNQLRRFTEIANKPTPTGPCDSFIGKEPTFGHIVTTETVICCFAMCAL